MSGTQGTASKLAASPRGRIDDSLWIDNERRIPSGDTYLVVDDSATGDEIAQVRSADADDVDRAFASARRAQQEWAQVSPTGRIAIVERATQLLDDAKDDLAATMQAEVGTVQAQIYGSQVGLGLAALRYTTAAALPALEEKRTVGRSEVVYEPAGVVGAITPWNYPLMQVALKVAPALVSGSTVVLKPPSVAPLTAFLIGEAFAHAGLPAGALNIVCGSGGRVGNAIAGHRDADFVSFTGSTGAGRLVAQAAAKWGTRNSLELGGKSAAIVLDDHLIEPAVRHTIASCFANAGQTCAALSRLIVPRHRLGEVEQVVRDVLSAVVVGDPRDPASTVGPLSNKGQQDAVLGYLRQAAESDGVRILADVRAEHLTRGWYVSPTVVVADDPWAPIVQEEVFGPVLVIQPADDEAHAVRLAEGTEFGLIARVWTHDDDRFTDVARRLRVGGVIQSDTDTDWAAPFGGVKHSGHGRERGVFGIEEYLVPKALQRRR
ncbi:aldehyde dehydrogenase [Microbacterium barkeri]|uniref:aldehyde dehydrogenase (NAD(+)) n=1 Tax=Microbacterium barkeri TaxID=33917 RepID=A0A9W6H4R8_9MICO|nr:aldehyde dehydrogenase family protein [Microbacterium barkeri]MDI6944270.1 aldehyde dehydrogenase family protein [Microbacterium barkeri]MDR6875650.1 acyl-CoA reductase-like NAD-dependent aldehyde dehydrogenase [Microbacterium barkeri]GLJ62283.1 aldehyde dehydrogenase [Microbacterium barkeri]